MIGIYMGNMATELWKDGIPENFDKFIHPNDMTDIILENTKVRKNLVIEEVVVKNLKE
jgi:hypothetical protein